MVISASLVVLLCAFFVYKADPTYEQFGFWANLRLEIAWIMAGKAGDELDEQDFIRAYNLGVVAGSKLTWDNSLEGSMNRHPAGKRK